MKKLYSSPTVYWLCCFAFSLLNFHPASAQAPDKINYQAVARTVGGSPIVGTSIYVRFAVHQGSAAGTVVWQEDHNSVTTNNFGLFNLEIGGGTKTGGTLSLFADIPWGSNSFWLEIFIDPDAAGGSGYTSMGSTQLISVPYAMHAATADSIVGGAGANLWKKTGNSVTIKTAADSVGIGTNSPTGKFEVLKITSTGKAGIFQINNASNPAEALFAGTNGSGTSIFGMNIGTGSAGIFQISNGGNGSSALMAATNGPGAALFATNTGSGLAGDFSGKLRTSTFQITTGAGTAGQVLTSDVSGNATWQNPTGGGPWSKTGSSIYPTTLTDFVGLGIATPTISLHVFGSAAGTPVGMLVEHSNGTGSSEINLKTNGGIYDQLELFKAGSSASGTIDGIPIANLSAVSAGANAGPVMLRTVTASPIYFLSNNLKRMIITAGGDVGIGINSTEAKLHVVPLIGQSKALQLGNDNQPTREWLFDVDGAANFSLSNENNGTPFNSLKISNIGDIHLGTFNSTTLQKVMAQGSLGIVDANGLFYTHFKGAVQGDDIVYTLPVNQAGVPSILKNDGSGNLSWQAGGGADNLGDHTATQNIILGTNWLSGDGTNSGIRIDAVGNVGIGNNPGVKLDVYGGDIRATNAATSAIYSLASDPSSTSYFSLVAHDAGSVSKEWRIVNAANSGQLNFWNGADRMKIDASGNVGIGVATPGAMLDVAGTTKLGTTGNSFSAMLSGVITVDPPLIGIGATATVNIAIANVTAGDRVFLTPPTSVSGFVVPVGTSAVAGGVDILFRNVTTGSGVDDPAANWSYLIIKP